MSENRCSSKPLCARWKASRKNPGLSSIKGTKGSNRPADPGLQGTRSQAQDRRLLKRVSWVRTVA